MTDMTTETSSESPWLTAEQERVWRNWVAANVQLPTALHRQLQNDSDLSLQDFEVLVYLTDTEEGRLRVSDLARELQWERSRLSHHVKRMAARELVCREGCTEDGRGAFVVITPRGRRAIEQAAPGHARTVRSLVFDSLTEDELAALASITEKLLANLAPVAAC
jgi:DNA-binding MarR family transcriptional regulator